MGRKNLKDGGGCLILFGAVFAIPGLFVMYLGLSPLLEARGMTGWVEVPCKILRTELESHRGDDSTSYKVTARYRYEFNGRPYTAERVSLHGGSDNIGSFHQDTHRLLKRHKQDGTAFRCFVNPSNPSEAILFRTPRWGLVLFMSLFGLVFFGVGTGIVIGGVWSTGKKRRQTALAAEHPGEPWLHRSEWAAGRINSGSKARMLTAVIIAAIAGVVGGGVALGIPVVIEQGKPWWAIALMGLFPAAGVLLVVWAVYELARWRKYGTSTFEPAATPGVLGGPLAGVIRIPRLIEPPEGFRQTLNCVRRITTGSGKNRSTKETTVYQDERVIQRSMSSGEPNVTAVPVLFALPYDQPQSTVSDSTPQVIWRLECIAEVPGVDYHASFDLPVFKTEESREDFQLDDSPIADYAAEVDPEVELRRVGVRRTLPAVGYGTRLVFPIMRNPGPALGLLAFSVIWWAVTIATWKLGAPLLFPIVFGIAGVLILWGLLDVMFYRATIDVDESGLTARGGLLGLGRMQRIDRADLAELDIERGMQSGKRVFQTIVARCQDGRKVKLAKMLPSRPAAEVVIREIRRALGEDDTAR